MFLCHHVISSHSMEYDASSQVKVVSPEKRISRPSPLRLLISQHSPVPSQPDSDGVSFVRMVPSEVLLHIFSFIPLEHPDGGRLVHPAMLVCKQWSYLFESIIFRNICFSRCGGSDLDRRILQFLTLLETSPRIRTYVRFVRLRLRYNHDNPVCLANFASILNRCQGIRKLYLRHPSSQGNQAIVQAIRNLPQLEDLNLSGVYTGLYTQLALSYTNLPNLKKLYLQRLGPRAAVGSTDLRRFGSAHSLTQQEFDGFFPPDQLRTSNLTSLSLDKPAIPQSVMSYIFQLPNRLTSITITRLGGTREHTGPPAINVQQILDFHSESLQEIVLGTTKSVRDQEGLQLEIPNVANFPSLRRMTLSAHQVLDASPATVHESLQAPKLHSLTISCSQELIGRRRDGIFRARHIPWFKEFAMLKKSDYKHSRLSRVYVDYVPGSSLPVVYNKEMPTLWPWLNIKKAQEQVRSLGPIGMVLLGSTHPRPCTEAEWDRDVKCAIMKRERFEFKSEDDILAKFRRRRLPRKTETDPLFIQEVIFPDEMID